MFHEHRTKQSPRQVALGATQPIAQDNGRWLRIMAVGWPGLVR